MNVSFFVLGFAMVAGSLLLYYRFDIAKSSRVGFSLFGVGGVGVLLVGLFPENTVPALHGIGALLPFLLGNAGLVVIGYGLKLPGIYSAFWSGGSYRVDYLQQRPLHRLGGRGN